MLQNVKLKKILSQAYLSNTNDLDALNETKCVSINIMKNVGTVCVIFSSLTNKFNNFICSIIFFRAVNLSSPTYSSASHSI